MANRKTISVTEEQHQMLESVKRHLEQKASEEMGLAQSGYSPSMVDALGFVTSKAEEQMQLEQAEDDTEDDFYETLLK